MKLTYPLLLNAKPQDKPYKIRDRDFMYLRVRVSVSGSKVRKFDYRLDGKDCSYTLGRFPDLSINDARQRRNEAAKLVASGIHPKAHELQLQLQTITHNKNTFWATCEDWIEDNRDRWSKYYCGQAIRFLSRYVKDSPPGKMPVRDILKEIQKITGATAGDDHLFPNDKDKSRPMSPTTINAALIRAGFNDEQLFRAHGARGTFSTWAHEQGFAPLAVERRLARVEKNRVSRAYKKAEFLPERKKMTQDWGDYLQSMIS